MTVEEGAEVGRAEADLLPAIDGCDVCGGRALRPLLDLGLQPLCDDLAPIGSTEPVPKYPVALLGCPGCLTVHQRDQVRKERLFPSSYHYRAGLTQDVLDGMEAFVDAARRAIGGDLRGRVVLDIGCNDGSLLTKFRREGAIAIGVEPTSAAADAEGRVDHVIRSYFDAGAVDAYLARFPKPDLITFTNVFAHISGFDALIEDLRRVASDETVYVIENHYLGAVLDRWQFDTFYHEHPRTYAQRSFEVVAERLGRRLTAVEYPQRYNGNIRVTLTPQGEPAPSNPAEAGFFDRFAEMGGCVERAKARFMERIAPHLAAWGPLPAKAFPGRASMIVTAYGLDETVISAAYERPGSPKIGRWAPATRIPILDETAFFEGPQRNAPAMINLAWHISDEIRRYVRERGFAGDIIDVYEP